MSPDFWGCSAWRFLHYITLAYPHNPTIEDKQNCTLFIYLLKDILPCKMCRDNFSKNIQNFPLTEEALKSKKNLVIWMIDFHNVVNKEIGKPELSYNEALDKLRKKTVECSNQKTNNKWLYLTTIFILVLLIIGLIIYIVKTKKN